MNRRDLLTASAGALALAAAPLSTRAHVAALDAVQRLRVGAVTITALSDGYVDFLTPQAQVLQGISVSDYEATVEASGRGPGARQADVNAYLVETGDRRILLDAGTNTGFVPTLGRTPAALAAAGVSPDEITDILITHLHPDHVGGLLMDDGAAWYPNARVLVHAAEHDYWINGDAAGRGRPDMDAQFQVAQTAARVSGHRWELFEGADLGLPGISAVPLFGHTPGHVGCVIESEGDRILVLSDIIHQPVIQFARPDVTVAFDVDQDLARATRRLVLDRVTTDRERVLGMHLPFPGAGRVERVGDGYRWLAEERQYV